MWFQGYIMQFVSKARYVRFSPYKLRPYVDVIRGKNVQYALDWLATCPIKRVVPISKMLKSAAANAKQHEGLEARDMIIKDIRVDEGPRYRYFKPGAMGRAKIYRRRTCHMSVAIENLKAKKD